MPFTAAVPGTTTTTVTTTTATIRAALLFTPPGVGVRAGGGGGGGGGPLHSAISALRSRHAPDCGTGAKMPFTAAVPGTTTTTVTIRAALLFTLPA